MNDWQTERAASFYMSSTLWVNDDSFKIQTQTSGKANDQANPYTSKLTP